MALQVGDVLTGENGKVSYGAVPTEVDITNWTIQKQVSPVNVSDNSLAGWEQYKPGKRVSWSGTFEGFKKAGDTPVPFNTPIDFTGTTDMGIDVQGSIIITQENYTVDVNSGDAVKISRNFQGTGELTETDGTV